MKEDPRKSISESELRNILRLSLHEVEEAEEKMSAYKRERDELIDSYMVACAERRTVTERQASLIKASIASHQGARVQYLCSISGYLTSSATFIGAFKDSVFIGKEKSHRKALHAKYEGLIRDITRELYDNDLSEISRSFED